MSIRLVFRVKRKAQQTLFVFVIPVDDLIFNIEVHVGFFGALIIVENTNDSFLFGDKDAVGAITGVSHNQRAIEGQFRKGALYADVDVCRDAHRSENKADGERQMFHSVFL